MRITDYSREQIKQFVQDGICPVQALRDYDVLRQIQNGEKITNVAYDNNLSRMGVYKIKNKYTPKV
jgi:CMP-2-keto-3-deoxyoctulosonic acid synthetase